MDGTNSARSGVPVQGETSRLLSLEAKENPKSLSNPREIAQENALRYLGTSFVSKQYLNFRYPGDNTLVVPKLSYETTTSINRSAENLRNTLINDVLIPTENSLGRLGWHRDLSASPGARADWISPNNRMFFENNRGHVLAVRPELPNMVRATDGRVYNVAHQISRPLPSNQAVEYSFLDGPWCSTNSLSDSQMTAANRSGSLTAAESRLWNAYSHSNDTLKTLNALENTIHPPLRAKTHPQLKSSSPMLKEVVLPFERNSGLTNALGQHNESLALARAELSQAETRFSEATIAKLDTACVLGAQFLNYGIDRSFFRDVPTSFRTVAIDLISPCVAFTNMSPISKLGAIVGSHFLARRLDQSELKVMQNAKVDRTAELLSIEVNR